MNQNLSNLFTSKRFWAAISGLAVVISQQFFPSLDPDQVNNTVLLISSWIIGETFRPVVPPTK